MDDGRYVELDVVKSRVEQSGTSFDPVLTRIIHAAEAAVDTITDRVWAEPADDSVRLFTPRSWSSVLDIDEATQVSLVETRTGGVGSSYTALDSTDWELIAEGEYLDALVSRDCWPLSRHGEPTVAVTAHWASTVEVPPDIKEATLVLVTRLFKRPTVPLGVQQIGTEIAVSLARIDPDVHTLLQRHIRMGVGA